MADQPAPRIFPSMLLQHWDCRLCTAMSGLLTSVVGLTSGPRACMASIWGLPPWPVIISVLYLSYLPSVYLDKLYLTCVFTERIKCKMHIFTKINPKGRKPHSQLLLMLTLFIYSISFILGMDFYLCYSFQKWHVVVIVIYHGCFPMPLNHLLQNAF